MAKQTYTPSSASDDKQPQYLFSLTDTELLSAIVKKQINPVDLAKKELSQRGLDINGKWIGFKTQK
jgi:hypothetical protein